MAGVLKINGTTFATEGSGSIQLQNANFDSIADNSISGDKIDGGTISGVTLASNTNFGSIANDSISGDKIDGGTISNSTLHNTTTFPVGHIIQTAYGGSTTQTTINSTTLGSGDSTGVFTVITPTSTSNKLLIQVNLRYWITDADIGFGTEIHDGTSIVYTDPALNTYNRNSDGIERAGGRYNFIAYISPSSAGSAITYTLRAFKAGTSDTFRVQENGGLSNMVIQEIQQ